MFILGILGLFFYPLPMKTYSVEHKSYQSQITLPKSQMVICERTHSYSQTNYIDTFGPSWNIMISKDKGAKIRSGNQWLTLNSPFALFVPAFGIVEIQITPGTWTWTSVMCLEDSLKTPLQTLLLQESVNSPLSLQSLMALFNRFKSSGIPLEEQRSPSAVAAIFKQSLRQTLGESIKIQELCEHHGYSRRVVSRAFKKAYGLSPVEYRHRIKIFAVLRLMAKGFSITDAVAEVGISEPKQFIIQFKRYLGKVPNEIKTSAKKASLQAEV